MPPTTTATTTVYSGEVIPTDAFSKDLHVKPVLGYYIFFTAELLDDDLKGKVESETPNKIAMCCVHNVGYLVFGTENEALEALKELNNLKWLSMDDWKRDQWKFDRDGKIKRKLAEAKANLQAWEGGEGGDDIDDFDIALARRAIATFEQRERLWVPEPLARAQALREALKEEWGWEEQTRVAISRAVKDLEEGAIYAWDASRDYDLVYEQGKLIYGTRDIGSLEDDLGEQGIWVEEPLGRTYRAGKVTVAVGEDDQFRNPRHHNRRATRECIVDTGSIDPSITMQDKMRLGRLARTRYVEYELTDRSRMRKATIRLDVAVFDLVGNVVVNWTRATVYIEDDDNDILKRMLHWNKSRTPNAAPYGK